MIHELNNMVFIHYGHERFDINLFFKQGKDAGYVKPKYGLWGCPTSPEYLTLEDVVKLAKSPKSLKIEKSDWFKRDRIGIHPINSRWSWFHELPNLIDFEIRNEKYFHFGLTKNAKIFIVEHITDIIPYCIMDDLRECLIERGYIDKENYRIEKDCWATTIDFDKMKEDGYDGMFVYHDGTELYNHTILEEWETDSIVVWNPKVIITI